ncbi:MAG: hypothetical protein A3J67_01905 [Parcubacteria group bacterium RIFCSPHIGHO2_02_FULL_48_10b]|nr:MAG: hypothetical protein A3J67_01905 [Parcubacteria group bacterium RIFCSPHIGHO2_02_FULL_48_10b]
MARGLTPHQKAPGSCLGTKVPSPKGFRCGVLLRTESKEAADSRRRSFTLVIAAEMKNRANYHAVR